MLEEAPAESAPSGDFRVDVIVRKGARMRGHPTSLDTYVTVQCWDSPIEQSETCQNTQDPVYDSWECSFTYPGVAKTSFMEASVEFSVYDDGWIVNSLIGRYFIEIGRVYKEPHHKLSYQWVELGNPGLQEPAGWLQVDVTVVAPGDRAAPDLPEVPVKVTELAKSPRVLRNGSGFVGVSGCVRMEVAVYKAQYLPQMDLALPGQELVAGFFGGLNSVMGIFSGEDEEKQLDANDGAFGRCDPYVQISFGGVTGKTDVVSNTRNPTFKKPKVSFDLDLPDRYTSIKFEVKDSDGLADDHIATARLDLSEISLSSPERGFLPCYGPAWVNLYGAPRAYLALGPEGRQKAHYERMNAGFSEGCEFRGRMLVAIRTQEVLPKRFTDDHPDNQDFIATFVVDAVNMLNKQMCRDRYERFRLELSCLPGHDEDDSQALPSREWEGEVTNVTKWYMPVRELTADHPVIYLPIGEETYKDARSGGGGSSSSKTKASTAENRLIAVHVKANKNFVRQSAVWKERSRISKTIDCHLKNIQARSEEAALTTERLIRLENLTRDRAALLDNKILARIIKEGLLKEHEARQASKAHHAGHHHGHRRHRKAHGHGSEDPGTGRGLHNNLMVFLEDNARSGEVEWDMALERADTLYNLLVSGDPAAAAPGWADIDRSLEELKKLSEVHLLLGYLNKTCGDLEKVANEFNHDKDAEGSATKKRGPPPPPPLPKRPKAEEDHTDAMLKPLELDKSFARVALDIIKEMIAVINDGLIRDEDRERKKKEKEQEKEKKDKAVDNNNNNNNDDEGKSKPDNHFRPPAWKGWPGKGKKGGAGGKAHADDDDGVKVGPVHKKKEFKRLKGLHEEFDRLSANPSVHGFMPDFFIRLRGRNDNTVYGYARFKPYDLFVPEGDEAESRSLQRVMVPVTPPQYDPSDEMGTDMPVGHLHVRASLREVTKEQVASIFADRRESQAQAQKKATTSSSSKGKGKGKGRGKGKDKDESEGPVAKFSLPSWWPRFSVDNLIAADEPVCVYVFVYQALGLLSTDDDSESDVYFRVSAGNRKTMRPMDLTRLKGGGFTTALEDRQPIRDDSNDVITGPETGIYVLEDVAVPGHPMDHPIGAVIEAMDRDEGPIHVDELLGRVLVKARHLDRGQLADIEKSVREKERKPLGPHHVYHDVVRLTPEGNQSIKGKMLAVAVFIRGKPLKAKEAVDLYNYYDVDKGPFQASVTTVGVRINNHPDSTGITVPTVVVSMGAETVRITHENKNKAMRINFTQHKFSAGKEILLANGSTWRPFLPDAVIRVLDTAYGQQRVIGWGRCPLKYLLPKPHRAGEAKGGAANTEPLRFPHWVNPFLVPKKLDKPLWWSKFTKSLKADPDAAELLDAEEILEESADSRHTLKVLGRELEDALVIDPLVQSHKLYFGNDRKGTKELVGEIRINLRLKPVKKSGGGDHADDDDDDDDEDEAADRFLRILYGHGADKDLDEIGGVGSHEHIYRSTVSKVTTPIHVRIYIVRARGLRSMDRGVNLLGWKVGQSASDPYVKVVVGDKTFGDRDTYVQDDSNPDIGMLCDFTATFPHESRAKVQIFDRDDLSLDGDELIGETAIDLEERLVSQRIARCGVVQCSPDWKDHWRDCFTPFELLRLWAVMKGYHPPTFTAIDRDGFRLGQYSIEEDRDAPTYAKPKKSPRPTAYISIWKPDGLKVRGLDYYVSLPHDESEGRDEEDDGGGDDKRETSAAASSTGGLKVRGCSLCKPKVYKFLLSQQKAGGKKDESSAGCCGGGKKKRSGGDEGSGVAPDPKIVKCYNCKYEHLLTPTLGAPLPSLKDRRQDRLCWELRCPKTSTEEKLGKSEKAAEWELVRDSLALHALHHIVKVNPEHVESRTLYNPKEKGMPQGAVDLWVDLFPGPAMWEKMLGAIKMPPRRPYAVPPPVDITVPKPIKFELRTTVLSLKDAPREERFDHFLLSLLPCCWLPLPNKSDFYVAGWITDHMAKPHHRQQTDVHSHSFSGNAEFNYRLVFPLEYSPHHDKLAWDRVDGISGFFADMFGTQSKRMADPILKLQVFDYDMLSFDDPLSGVDIDLRALRVVRAVKDVHPSFWSRWFCCKKINLEHLEEMATGGGGAAEEDDDDDGIKPGEGAAAAGGKSKKREKNRVVNIFKDPANGASRKVITWVKLRFPAGKDPNQAKYYQEVQKRRQQAIRQKKEKERLREARIRGGCATCCYFLTRFVRTGCACIGMCICDALSTLGNSCKNLFSCCFDNTAGGPGWVKLEIELVPADEAERAPVGKGRAEPQPLPPPSRAGAMVASSEAWWARYRFLVMLCLLTAIYLLIWFYTPWLKPRKI